MRLRVVVLDIHSSLKALRDYCSCIIASYVGNNDNKNNNNRY
jgi:hypothetical protein